MEESLIILFLAEQGYDKAREALSSIAKDVPREQESCFDPSGLQGDSADATEDVAVGSVAGTGTSDLGRRVPSAERSVESWSQNTPLSPADALDDWRAVANDLPGDGSSTVAILISAFPTLRESDIRRALKETGDDVDKASDILLNLEHLEQTGQRAKGIDAFFVPDEFQHARKSKKKRKNKTDARCGSSEPKTGRDIPLALDYKLAPLPLGGDDEESAERASGNRRAQTKSAPPDRPSGAGLDEHNEAARQARAASNQSFAAASAAARRGRSDPLFRQAAVVYAERGHDLARAARKAESSASDALVDGQSAAGVVDVHFVPVHDGVRIAVERTRRWWAHLGEDRIRKARDDPLQVVTGIGLHSARGFSRMYGEVGAALKRDGWKVQPGQGHYYVTGKT